jgi:hypothetical protein
MVNVANRANVNMRLVALKFTFCHRLFPWANAGFLANAARLATTARKDKPFRPTLPSPFSADRHLRCH